MLTKVKTYQIYDNLPYTRGVVIRMNENEAIVAKFVGRKERDASSKQYYDLNTVLLTSKENPYLLSHYDHEEMVFVRCQYNGIIEGIEEIEWVEVSPKFEVVREGHIRHKQLQILDKYLMETPQEELDKIRDEILEKSKNSEGPTVEEYFESFGGGFTDTDIASIIDWVHITGITRHDRDGEQIWMFESGEIAARNTKDLIKFYKKNVWQN